jgi:hypothetical protein
MSLNDLMSKMALLDGLPEILGKAFKAYSYIQYWMAR